MKIISYLQLVQGRLQIPFRVCHWLGHGRARTAIVAARAVRLFIVVLIARHFVMDEIDASSSKQIQSSSRL